MKALLDTSVLIANREQPIDLTGIVGRLSSVSYGELSFGIAVAKTERERAFRLMRFHRVQSLFGEGIPMDDQVAASYGFLYGLSHAAGKRSRTLSADIMIAATAHHHRIPLVTRNASDFEALSDEVEIIVR